MPSLKKSCAQVDVEYVKQADPVRVYIRAHAASLLAASYAYVVVPGFHERKPAQHDVAVYCSLVQACPANGAIQFHLFGNIARLILLRRSPAKTQYFLKR